MVSLCPTNHSRQNAGQHASNDDRLKAKQQCESGMRWSGSGNLRNLPKLRLVSRLLLYSLARRLAQTAPIASRLVHSCLPSSARLPNRTGNWGSTTPASLVIKSSANGSSRSRTTRGPFLIFSLWRSSSSSLNGFPWKSSTRHPGVSRRKRWSRAKWRLPWKCRNTSWCPCVSTDTFFRHTWEYKWLGILAASDGPVTRNLPSSVAAYTFFMQKVSLDRIFRRPLLASVSSPLVSDVSIRCGLCDGPCFSQSSTSFSSANRKTDIVRLNTKLLNPSKAENTNYTSRETAVVLSPPQKRTDIGTPSDDQRHESQWQRDRSRIDLQRNKCGINLEPTWNNNSKFLIWALVLPSWNACSNCYLLRPRLWTAPGTSCWGPPANGTRLLVTTMWRSLNCPSVSTPVDTPSFPETPGIVSASPGNKQGMSHWYD